LKKGKITGWGGKGGVFKGRNQQRNFRNKVSSLRYDAIRGESAKPEKKRGGKKFLPYP